MKMRILFVLLSAIVLLTTQSTQAQCSYPLVNEIVIEMNDSYGDGWNGTYYHIYNSDGVEVASGTLSAWENSGNWDNDDLSLVPGEYTISVNGGITWWWNEISWEIVNNASGETLIDGGAPTSNASFSVPTTDLQQSNFILTSDGEACSDEFFIYTYKGENSSVFYNSTILENQDIGFPFTFYGTEYNTISISADGYVTFDPNPPASSSWNINTPPDLAIMFPFHNMMPNYGGNGEISYGTIGEAPNRIYIVTFFNAPMFGCLTTSSTQQLRLYEGSNKIETYIYRKPVCGSASPLANEGKATHGLRSGINENFVQGRNASVWEILENAPDAKEFIPDGDDNYTINDIAYSPIIGGDITWYDENQIEIGSGSSLFVSPTGSTTYEALCAIGTGLCGSDEVTVSPGSVPAVILEDTAICDGISITLDAGDYESFEWNTGEITQSISVNSGGLYSVSVTSSNGCVVNAESEVIENPVPDLYINNIASVCLGESVNLSELLINDNNNIVGTTSWHSSSPADNTNLLTSTNITPSSTTTYYLKKITDFGCQSELAVEIAVHSLPITSLNDMSVCEGDTAILFPGIFDSYLWNDNSINDTLFVTENNSYSVEVMDNNGCTTTDTIDVVINQLPNLNIADVTICQGGSAILNAGNFDSYLWNTSETSATIYATIEGNYFVDVTDQNNCTNRDSLYLTVHDLPNPILTDSSFCIGDTINLYPGEFENYSWNNGSDVSVISVFNSGTYTVEVTDTNNCNNSSSSTIEIYSLPEISMSDEEICSGDTLLLNPGSFSEYFWSTGELSNTIEVLNQGFYSVLVIDANNCSATDSVYITVNELPISSLSDTTICFGDTTTLNAGIFTSYLWSNDNTTSSISVFDEGIYSVEYTNENNCTNTNTIYLTVNNLPSPTLDSLYSFCNGDSILLNPGSFSNYFWSTNESSDSIVVYTSGIIDVLVTDSNGCQNQTSTEIEAFDLPIPQLSSIDLCEGDSITLTPGDFSTYLWSTTDTTSSITVSTNELFFVTVSNEEGCFQTDSITIIVNSLPIPVLNDTTICDGDIIALNPGVYSEYSWNTTETSNSIFVNEANTYSVTVTDENGCVSDTSAIVSVNNLPTPILSDVQFCQGDSALLYPGSFVSYNWSNISADSAIYVTSSDNYYVTVTDTNNCQNQASAMVIAFTIPNPQLQDEEICEGENTVLNSGIFSDYSWNTGATTQMLNVTDAGVYSITVTDGNGCQNTAESTISINALPNPQITQISEQCLNADLSDFESFPIGGIFTGNGVVNNSQFNPIKAGVGSHEITYTFIDNNNCSNTDTIYVEVNPIPYPFAGDDETVCGLSYNLNGAINVDVFCVWDNIAGASFNNIQNPHAIVNVEDYGIYNFTLKETNSHGCTNIDDVSISFNEGSLAFAGNDMQICPDDTIILAELTANNYQTFNWETSGSGDFLGNDINCFYAPSTNDIENGSIVLTLNLENSPCPIVSDDMLITINPKPTVTINGDESVCEHNVESVLFLDFTGTPPFIYQVNDLIQTTNNFTDSFNINKGGVYNVVEINDANCNDNNVSSIEVIGRPIPIADFSATNYEIDMHDPVITFYNQSQLANSFEWNFGDNQIDSMIYHPVHEYDSAGTYIVTLFVETEYGCIDSLSREVYINPVFYYYVPDAFTPDRDGLNETFIGKGEGYIDFQMSIYTKWGEIIYQTDNDLEAWNGQYNNTGTEVPSGVYFYKISFNDEGGKLHNYLGEVSLIR